MSVTPNSASARQSPPQLGFIGLGKMGGNMVRRLALANVHVAVFDASREVTQSLCQETGGVAADSVEALVRALDDQASRVLWLMLPAGEVTSQTLATLTPLLKAGDVVVDGANSNYNDSIARAANLAQHGIAYVDAGVSGGVHGLANGYCLMVGGEANHVKTVQPYLEALAASPTLGWLHAGPAGAGHFCKMVHNGIEYGMMAALAEGLALLKGKTEFDLDLAQVSELWRSGSVVRSWLLDLTAQVLKDDQALADVKAYVSDSGEGRWTVNESIAQGVPTPVMTMALMSRFASQGADDYASKLLAKMRQGFGGHAVQSK